MIKWHPPDRDFVKINFDAYVQHKCAVIGFVFCDVDSNPLATIAKFIGDTSVLIVETIALKEGLHTTWLQQIPKVVIEGDSKVLIDCITGKATTPWCISSLLQDI
ncbi:hypothetical protein ACLB2K_077615 [Fragaria x ananassa]